MILIGSRPREDEIASGQFYCPICRALKPYSHKRVSRYFTLYFIPVFPIAKLGEYVQCQNCKKTFPPEALRFKPPIDPGLVLSSIQHDLEAGVSIQKVRVKLLGIGLRGDVADKVIDYAVGGKRKTCRQCGASFMETANYCGSCGSPLDNR